MNYQEQLLDNRWKEKRDFIIKRDNLKCRNCNNESYKQNYNYGLVFSNKLQQGGTKTVYHNNKFIISIWDFKNNKVERVFTNNTKFSTEKNYIAIYKEGVKYSQLLALKDIPNYMVELNTGILTLIEKGLRGKVSEKTYNEIYRPENIMDKWELVYGLHVHHKYYQEGLMAWEYPNDALITLCWDCHEKLHSNSTVPVLDANGIKVGALTPCKRCHGAGMFPEYIHVESGICFRCRGAKYEELI